MTTAARTVLLTALALFSASSPAAAEDGGAIDLGQVVVGEISEQFEVDTYSIDLPAGQWVYLDRVSTSNVNGITWALIDAYGRRVAENTGALNDLGPLRVMGGAYTLEIASDAYGSGDYEVRVLDATPVELAGSLGTTLSGSVTAGGRVDYDLTVAPGTRLYLERVSGTNTNFLNWQVHDAYGRELLSTGSLNDVGPIALVGGDYTVSVVSEGDGEGDFEVVLHDSTNKPVQVIALDVPVVGSVDSPAQQVPFEFTAAPGDSVFLDLLSATGGNSFNWRLTDSHGRDLLSQTSSLDNEGPFVLEGGVYELVVIPEGVHMGSFEFVMRTVPAPTTTPVTVGVPFSGEVAEPGEVDRFSFSTGPLERLVLDVVTSNVNGLNLRLEDALGRAVIPQTSSLKDEGPLSLLGGDYTITILGEEDQLGTYDILLSAGSDDMLATSVGASLAGALDAPGDRDLYTFAAATGQVLELDFSSVVNSNGLNVTLFDEVGHAVIPRTASLGDQGPVTLLGGAYSLVIEGEIEDVGSYALDLVDLGVDTSFVPAGTPLALGDVVDTSVAQAGVADQYALDVPVGERVYFDLLVGTTDLDWTLLDPVGRELFSTNTNSAISDDRGPFVLAGGTYTLSFLDDTGATPAYSFVTHAADDTTAPVALGGTAAGAFATPGDVQRFSLDLVADSDVFFEVIDGDSQIRWVLRDPAGQPVWDETPMNSATFSQGPFPLAAGEYVLTLDPRDDYIPEFEVGFVAVSNSVQTIAVGELVSDVFSVPGSTKTYDFVAAAGQTIVIDLIDGDSNLRWSLFDTVGQPIFAGATANSATNHDQGPFTLAGGSYRLVLDPRYATVPAFAFQLVEPQDLDVTAQPGLVLSDTIPGPGSVHRYSFDLPAPTTIYVDNLLGVQGARVALIDPVGVPVFSNQDLSSTSLDDEGPHALAAGVYVLELQSTGVALVYEVVLQAVVDKTHVVALDEPVVTSIDGVGARSHIDVDVPDGTRVHLDLLASTSGAQWTLRDPNGESAGFFSGANANSSVSHDQGPFVLAGGTYTVVFDGSSDNLPATELVVRAVDKDLQATSLGVLPGAIVDGQTDREVELTWTVDNLGGGADLLGGTWVDRVVLSTDTTIGDADDVTLFDFDGPGVAADASYTRTEVIVIPDDVALGDYHLGVLIDADDELLESGGEDNNTVSKPFNVVPPPGSGAGCIAFDQLDGTEFPVGTTLALSGRANSLQGSVNVSYVIDISTSTQFVCGLDSNFDGIVDANDDLNQDNGTGDNPNGDCTEGSILDSEIGATLLIDALLGANAEVAHSVVPFAGPAKTADMGPETGKQTWVAPHDRDADEDGVVDFETLMKSAYAIGGPFGVFGSEFREFSKVNVGGGTIFDSPFVLSTQTFQSAPAAGQRLMFFLTDGLPVPENAFPSQAQLLEAAALGIDFRAFQIGLPVVDASLEIMAQTMDSHPDSTGSVKAVADVNDLLFELVQSVTVVGVTVNGVPADGLDAAGRFFHQVTIGPGVNAFQVEAIDSDGNACVETITFVGVTPGDGSTDDLSDVTASIDVDFSNSTLDLATGTYAVQAEALNAGDGHVGGPLLMVFDGFDDPSVSLRSPDGYLSDGRPYMSFLDLTVQTSLAPGEDTPRRTIRLDNPTNQPVGFDWSWLALGNVAPFFATSPDLTAVPDEAWSYTPGVSDPDGHVPTLTLLAGPAGLAFDGTTLSWTPSVDDLGSHQISVGADDGWGGTATQAFVLVVEPDDGNQPPVFTSTPVVQAPVGGAYAYQATASDPDDDPLTFALLDGPAGLSADASGLVTWDFALPGTELVVLEVSDGQGGAATQAWLLAVGEASGGPGAPVLIGSPASSAVVDQLYLYQPLVDDADPFATHTWSLDSAPAGMTIDETSGRVLFTPDESQLGDHQVALRVTADDGTYAVQSWTLAVVASGNNGAPVLLSAPVLTAFLGVEWTYAMEALDPEGSPLLYDVAVGPAAMTVDAQGVVRWTPDVTGPVTVGLTVSDSFGATGHQVFDLLVSAGNNPPVITTTPPTSLFVGETLVYDADATDPDGHAVSWGLLSGPDGMAVGGLTGQLVWTPGVDDVGLHAVTLAAADAFGGLAEQQFDLDVIADVTPPDVAILVSVTPGAIFEPVTIAVQASDDAAIVERSLTVNGQPLALDVAGTATYVPDMQGVVDLMGGAMDSSGNVGSAHLVWVVGPDENTPVVELHSPGPEDELGLPFDIVASIDDDLPAALTWEVRLRKHSEDPSADVVIATGTGPVDNAAVASVDPTALPNDTYVVSIEASDASQTGGIAFKLHLQSQVKFGQFAFEQLDLSLPLAGLPLAVGRRYDSFDTAMGDFGPGWSLALPGDVTDSKLETDSDQGLVQLLGNEPFSHGTRVFVTLPDGRRVGFTFEPQTVGHPVPFQHFVHFEPDEGVQETLEAVGPALVANYGGVFFDFAIPYNPDTYILTTEQGLEYTISEESGLQLIEDANGNTISVTPEGLFSSLGTAILFERDAEGRITRVIEPADDGQTPGDIHYLYDGVTGNLVGVLDQVDALTTYGYEAPGLPHHLTSIDDPTGVPVTKSVFDDDGKLVALCGPQGDVNTLEGCTAFDADADLMSETIFTPRGIQIDDLYDTTGNLVLRRVHMGDGEVLEFEWIHDEKGRLIVEIDPADQETHYTYGGAGNLTSITDPAGRTTTFAYDVGCGEVSMRCDPAGNCTFFTYDEDCNLLMVEDGLGLATQYAYDGFGRLTDIWDAVGDHWHFAWGTSGYPEAVTDPRGEVMLLDYNKQGELLSMTDREGRITSWDWDDAHRMVRETWDDGTVIDYAYDDAGKLLTATTPDTTLAYTWWNVGLPRTLDNIGTAGAPEVTLSYGFDQGGELQPGYDGHINVTHVTDSLGGHTEYGYDHLDRLVSIAQRDESALAPARGSARGLGVGASAGTLGLPGKGGATSLGSPALERLVTFHWDAASLLREVHRFKDLDGTDEVVESIYDYDCGGCAQRVTGIEHRRAGDRSVIHAMTWQRDDLGNPVSGTDAEGSHQWLHDAARRLVSADRPNGGAQVDEAYTYDDAGNRQSSHLSSSATYGYETGGGGQQLLADDRYDYVWNRNGQLQTRTDSLSGHVTTYTWDHRGRLTSVVEVDGAAVELHRAEYVYDAIDRKVRSTEDGVVRHYVYDRENPILVLDDLGQIVTRRMYGRTYDEVWAEETAGATRWLLGDQVRTLRDAVDDDGNVVWHRVYDAFGNVVQATGATTDTDLTYMARPASAVTGLLDFRARAYDPGVGRFLSEDPVAPFHYSFVENSPLQFLDPDGRTALIEFACFAVSAYNSAQSVAKLPGELITAVSEIVVTALQLGGGGGGGGDPVGQFLENLIDLLLGQINPIPDNLIEGLCALSGN